MTITSESTIHELLNAHPFLLDFLANYDPKFGMLRNPLARATMGRVATLSRVAGIGSVPLEKLLADIRHAVAQHDHADAAGAALPGKNPVPRLLPMVQAPDATCTTPADPARVAKLKEIVESLHRGVPVDSAKAWFEAAFGEVSHDEVVAMEEQLIRDGTRPEEIQRLCDVHLAVVKGRLAGSTTQVEAVPAGHPADTMRLENRAISEACRDLTTAAQSLNGANGSAGAVWEQVAEALARVSQLERHYLRKEYQLFPFLEQHGITGPSQVMWGIHDEVRAMLKDVRAAVERRDRHHLGGCLPGAARAILDMIFKEENILLPMSLQTLREEEWKRIAAGEREFGYALVEPRAAWPEALSQVPEAAPTGNRADAQTPTRPDRVPADAEDVAVMHVGSSVADAAHGMALRTGLLTLEQISLLLGHLPIDVTFVNERDEVAYFSDTKDRLFPRTAAIIGRKVQLCHPPKSLHVVNRILDDFRAGRKDVAEFWIQMKGRHIHIRYFAVRDDAGEYRGTLEVTQDITDIKRLEGERRLLDWEE